MMHKMLLFKTGHENLNDSFSIDQLVNEDLVHREQDESTPEKAREGGEEDDRLTLRKLVSAKSRALTVQAQQREIEAEVARQYAFNSDDDFY